MIPTSVISEQIVDLLAADTTTLAPALNGCKVHLIKAPFTPGPTTDLASLTPATFTGSTPLVAGTGTQQVFVDPVTSLRILQLLEPAGGWHWACTVDPSPSETIVGYCVTDNAGTTTYGSALLPAPITINAAGQGIDLPQIRFTFTNNSPY